MHLYKAGTCQKQADFNYPLGDCLIQVGNHETLSNQSLRKYKISVSNIIFLYLIQR